MVDRTPPRRSPRAAVLAALVALAACGGPRTEPVPHPASTPRSPAPIGALPGASDAAVDRSPLAPASYLGRPVAADFDLVDWAEVSGYWSFLAEGSPNVRLTEVGRTSEGRPFLLAAISSEANLARLDRLQEVAARLADPRGLSADEREALLDEAVPFLFVALSMHATECAAAAFGLEFGHRLATSDEEPYRSARERLVVFVPPTLNPDGLERVTSWYRRTVGTPDEDTDLVELYQRYAGHDNNRDGFALALDESRIVARLLYQELFPQVLWDVHQQGQRAERFFVPPYRDPLNPNLDEGVVTAIGAIGSRAMFDMTRAGLTGISTGVSYDMWWNGGNRSTPLRHHVLSFLTEAASVNLASPVFLPRSNLVAPRGLAAYQPSNRFPAPWPGGWWRQRDIVEYEHAFAASLLASLVREPRVVLENFVEAIERTVARGQSRPPTAYLVRTDGAPPRALRRLVELLTLSGVELHTARAAFDADDVPYPAGTLVVRLDQPYGRHAKDVLEFQRYPEGEPPYDVAGWSLPPLFGLEVVEVQRPFEASLARLADAGKLDGPAGDERAWTDLEAAGIGGEGVRIGVLAPWTGLRGEGWLGWFLDSYGIPFTRVRPEEVRAGRLAERYDVLIATSASNRLLESGRSAGPAEYEGGLGTAGALALRDFVAEGGRLAAIGTSVPWTRELFAIAAEDVTRGEGAKDFSCPGSVLRTELSPAGRALGLDRAPAVLFAGSSAFDVTKLRANELPAEAVLTYPSERVLLAGWIRGEATLAGRAAWVRARSGAGEVHLLGFEPQYRGWSEAAARAFLSVLLRD